MSCVPSPTQTLFETVTSESLSTSFSSSVTTLPDSTSTILITTCVSSSSASGTATDAPGCASSTVLTSTTVIDGGVSTVQVPVTVTVDVPQTIATATLFSSCSSQTTSHQSSKNSQPTPPNPPPTSDSQTSTFLTTSTPTTTFTSSFSTTLPNGDVVGTTATVTSTLPPTPVLVTTTAPARETQQGGSGGGGSGSSNLGPILGGTLGGFFGLLAIGALLWFFCRRKPTWDDIFEKEDFFFEDPDLVRSSRGRSNFDISGDSPSEVDPKPYHYGLVGGTRSPNSEYAGVPLHERRSSETPLMSQHNASAGRLSVNAAGSKRTSYPSRPSTSGSLYPGAGPSSTGHGPMVTNNSLAAIPPGAAPPIRATPSPADDPTPVIPGPSPSSPATAPLIPLSPSTPPRPHATSVDATGSPTTTPGVLPEKRMLFIANQDPGSPTSTSFSLVDAVGAEHSAASSPTTPSPGPSALGFVPYPSAVSEKQRLRARDSILSATSMASQASAQTLSHPVLTPTQVVFATPAQGPTPGSPTGTVRAASPEGIPQLPPIRASSPVLAYLTSEPNSPLSMISGPREPARLESPSSQNSTNPPPPAYTD